MHDGKKRLIAIYSTYIHLSNALPPFLPLAVSEKKLPAPQQCGEAHTQEAFPRHERALAKCVLCDAFERASAQQAA